MDEKPAQILIESLQDPALYDHPVRGFIVLETHISWVILTGDFAYKIKKPVSFAFLDFSTLALRHKYCLEEVRLNSRYAADLYLEVVGIYGDCRKPSLRGDGEPMEYAVKMRQFPQDALLSRLLESGQVRDRHIDAMAKEVAAFHETARRTTPDESWGTPGQVQEWALENFSEITPMLRDGEARQRLDALLAWTEKEFQHRHDQLQARKREGCIRECHGDLHLGNMFLQGDRVRLFDCIEFNEELRWIDVMCEAAFVFMDLCDRGRPEFAWRFLNRYLQHTGDYDGLAVLAYYFIYRALVRAKVCLLRLSQGRLDEKNRAKVLQEFRGYLDLAREMCERPAPALIITHGLSGSGKSLLAEKLAETLSAVHVRSDIERKRLYGYDMAAQTGSSLHTGIYTDAASARTYARLGETASAALDGGYTIIVDATFLERGRRQEFLELARRTGVTAVILDFQIPEEVLRKRILERQRSGGDVSEAGLEVLASQLQQLQPLTAEEQRHAVVIDSIAENDPQWISREIRRVMQEVR
jgi:aminoglycoside phosphotransferase family enzyme/predicted kinase